jgi:hypothetical protein
VRAEQKISKLPYSESGPSIRYHSRMTTATQTQLLSRALLRFALPLTAHLLGITLAQLERYLAGHEMPPRLLLRLIDLVTGPAPHETSASA